MLNLYAVLGVSTTAPSEAIQDAIDTAETSSTLPIAILQSARFYLLDPSRREAYNKALLQALQQGTLTLDWEAELAKQSQLPMVQHHAHPNWAQKNTNPNPLTQAIKPNKMKKRHWLGLMACGLVTMTLAVILWEMAQVQLHQNQQVATLNQLNENRRLPELWPTWQQEQGETFLMATDQSKAKLSIYKNSAQDLPVLSMPRIKRLDCGERGNQYCQVTFTFDGKDPRTFKAQIIGATLVFNHSPDLPILMDELSRATRIQTTLVNLEQVHNLTFERTVDIQAPTPPDTNKKG